MNATSKKSNGIRKSAGGHRFGPNLRCGECGRTWEEHQHHPVPCEAETSVNDPAAALEDDASKPGLVPLHDAER